MLQKKPKYALLKCTLSIYLLEGLGFGEYQSTQIRLIAEKAISAGAHNTELVEFVLHCEKGSWPLDYPDMESIDIQNRGKPFANGYFFVVWNLGGDEDWNINYLDMPGHWHSFHCCRGCKANKSDTPMSFSCFADDAAWMGTIFSNYDDWVTWCEDEGKCVHLLFKNVRMGAWALDHGMPFMTRCMLWIYGWCL